MFRKAIILGASLVITTSAFAKTIRASKLGEQALVVFLSGDGDDVLEFRSGDEIRVVLKAEGDLFETTDSVPTRVKVKTTFFVKKDEDQVLMSFDGREFKPIKDAIAGQLSASASGDDAATDISITLSAYISQ